MKVLLNACEPHAEQYFQGGLPGSSGLLGEPIAAGQSKRWIRVTFDFQILYACIVQAEEFETGNTNDSVVFSG